MFSANPPKFVSEDEAESIQMDDEIRVKVTGVRVDTNKIFAIGGLGGDYLGLTNK